MNLPAEASSLQKADERDGGVDPAVGPGDTIDDEEQAASGTGLQTAEGDAEKGGSKDVEANGPSAPPDTPRLPTPSKWERAFETIMSIATGVVFISKVVKPTWLFIVALATLWIAWTTFQAFRHGFFRIMKLWGVRFEHPNLLSSFIPTTIFFIVAMVFICVGARVRDKPIMFDNWHLWVIFSCYPFYGVLQHVMLQGLILRNLSWCVTGSDEKTVLHAFFKRPRCGEFWQLLACIMISAALFGFVHFPEKWLMAGTAVLGLPWATFYLYHRNVIPLGLYHGWLGAFYYFWFLGRDPLKGTFGSGS